MGGLNKMAPILQMTFQMHFFNENWCVLIGILLKFVPYGSINIMSVLVQVMAWHLTGTKPLTDPMLTHIYDGIWCHYTSVS